MNSVNGLDLDDQTWEQARLLVAAEITRNARSIHDLRGKVWSLTVRLAVAEARLALFGTIGGFLGSLLYQVVFRGH